MPFSAWAVRELQRTAHDSRRKRGNRGSESGDWIFFGQGRRFVPLGKGDAALFAAGGLPVRSTPPVVPLAKWGQNLIPAFAGND